MKKLLSILFISLFSNIVFALPGFSSYIPDSSGNYVYYKDNSFVRESYIGILMYNESSFQIRYVAPEDKEKKLEKIDIGLLISIDPKSDYWNMTGERLLGTINNTPEEIDILNYLHDILYEFTSRRKKVDNVSPKNPNYKTDKNFYNNGITVQQDYPQFGGKVFINFDPLIPLFNLKAIYDTKGNILMQCVLIGKILSSEDTMFNDFCGFGSKKFTTELEKQDKKVQAYTVKTMNNYSIKIDKNWTSTEGTDFLYTFGDEAFLAMVQVGISEKDDTILSFMKMTRENLMSASGMYADLRDVECSINLKTLTSKTYKITTEINKNRYSSYTLYSKQKGSNNFAMFTLTTTFHAYNVRNSYYNKIIKSFKDNN